MATLRPWVRAAVLMGFACIGSLGSPTQAATNQWAAIGPVGATISALAFDGATIYAGTFASGVLTSADAGATWRLANEGLTDVAVLSLAVDSQTGSTLYAGTASGLFKSVDGAAHWTAAGFQDGAHRSVNSIAVDPAAPRVLYAATSAGLYKSLDAAKTWSPIAFDDFIGNDVAVDPASPATVYFSGDQASGFGSGVYRSVDAGTTWTKIRTAPLGYDFAEFVSAGHVYIDPGGSGRLYVVFAGDSVIASQDAGATWSALPVPWPAIARVAAFAVDRSDARTLYVGTSDGKLLRSADGGQSWTDTTTTLQSGGIGVLAATHATVYAGATNGLFTSTDAGATWKAADLGVRRVPSGPLLVDPTTPSTIYASVDGFIVKSADAGAHWLPIGPTLGRVVALALDPPSTLYAGTVNSGVPTLYKSVDGGAHWSTILGEQVRQPVGAIAIASHRASTIYVSMQEVGIIRSDDAGASGLFVNDPLGNPALVAGALAVDPSDAGVVYAGGNTGRNAGNVRNIYKSIDAGRHWQPIAVDVPTGTVVSRIAVDPSARSTIYAAFLGSSGAGSVYKSVQAGATWFPAGAGLPSRASITAFVIDPANPQRLYAGGGTGVYRSIDGGTTWTALGAAQPMRDVGDLALDPSGKVLRAATASGLFEYRFTDDSSSVVTVVEYHNSVFDHYFITSNADEIANLDGDVASVWVRTGLAFHAFAAPSSATVPVCRFFSTAFAPRSSHFYSPFAYECAHLRGDAHWLLETSDAFDIVLPSGTGECAIGLVPVYRLYNDGHGGAPNHRYTTDRAVRAQMIAQGWVPEGLGPEAVQMCAAP